MEKFEYSQEGFSLTKHFEGCVLTAYADQGGIWTIGYGHTGPEVHPGLQITQAQAETLLKADLSTAAECVNQLVQASINQNQFDALVDFVFNLGCASLSHSMLLEHIHADRLQQAALEFLRWNHVHGAVVPGLTKRRQAESILFQKPL